MQEAATLFQQLWNTLSQVESYQRLKNGTWCRFA